jgi:hypothetical protein
LNGGPSGLVVFLIVLLAPVVAQGQTPTKPRNAEIAAIALYAKEIEQFTKRNPRKKRMFGNVAGEEDKGDKWQEFKSAKKLEDENLDESAYVWLKDGKTVVAYFSFTSQSGDWYHYVTYYFRADGTLAKIHSQLNTFYGDTSVVRDKYYSSNGKRLRATTRYLDLQTQKPTKHPDFQDEPIPIYLTVRKLPFFKLL